MKKSTRALALIMALIVFSSSAMLFASASANGTGNYIVTATAGVNVRSGPGTQYAKITAIPYNTQISVSQVSGSWGLTVYCGRQGWACLDYASKIQTPTPPANQPSNFTPRTTAPSTGSFYYYSQNIFYNCGHPMPNCTTYAWGRAWEMTGSKLPSGYFQGNAYSWWQSNINCGKFKYGSVAKPGSIAVWRSNLPGSGNCGHVAIVESVSNGQVYVSQSFYGGSYFKYSTIANTGYLYGYIYLFDRNW
jgi:hypothetical protein